MNGFLQRVAHAYAEHEPDALIDYCFVFPNRRSGTFFRDYLIREFGNGLLMPRIATLNEIVAEQSTFREATRDEALFALYNCYRAFMAEEEQPDFDRFIFWGSMLLDDFNEVDSNLVDVDQLFVNVERWREIRSFYLTRDQADIIERYWGEKVLASEDVEQFWQHIQAGDHPAPNGEGASNARFMRLWEILAPLYHKFTESMAERQLATQGMMMRQLIDQLDSDEGAARLRAQRYVFVGFDIPTLGEIHLFRHLQKLGRADFYWDFNSPVSSDSENTMARLLANLRTDFPPLYDLEEEPITTFPEIEIIGVPSETGQAKMAGDTISQWLKEGVIADKGNAVDTAVVLPDESLFVPMVHAIPAEITNMNVTMGFPLRFTPVSALIRIITSLHLRARIIRGVHTFFYEDVEAVTANTIVRGIASDECDGLRKMIRDNRLYNVGADVIAANFPTLAKILRGTPVDNTAQSAREYIDSLLTLIEGAVAANPAMKMEGFFVRACREALDQLFNAVEQFGIDMRESIFLHLLERMLFNATVRFEGEPLKGLQVMGVLETRALDFDNVIITSMNERIFPKKSYVRSFIPDTLRRCYGLPTPELAESRFAYYFYRLLSRASRVTLLYDTRSDSSRNNEISRFVTQLLYLYPSSKVTHKSAVYPGLVNLTKPIEVHKTHDIMERLKAFTTDGENASWLSASALKTYLNCPLSFCLQYVMQMRVDDEITDYMDASVLGRIVHHVFEKLYDSLNPSIEDPATVTRQIIDGWINNEVVLRRLIAEGFNLYHSAPGTPADTPLRGENVVIAHTILYIVKKALREDARIAPFEYLSGEEKMRLKWQAAPGLSVNFKLVIDRIDRVKDITRIVDYKTGDEESKLNNFGSMFAAGKTSKERALFQVLLYCKLFAAATPDYANTPIEPMIYNLRKVAAEGFTKSKYNIAPENRQASYAEIGTYQTLEPELTDRINRLICEIFDPKVSFTQAESEESCTFCPFKEFCGRQAKTNK